MKKYKKYPKYKDSRVEWIGDIPEGWDLKDFKYIFKYDTGGTPPSKNRSYYDGNNFWVTIEDLNQRVISDTADKITDEAVELFNIPLSPKGALLISFKLSVGIVSFAGCDLYTNEAIATILPQEKRVDLNYWYYVFANYFINNANENIYGAKLFNQRSIKNSLLVFPELEQQKQISAFLDKETARIDAIVEKQKQFIELLKEKRAAVITQAVTKGLDPKAKMKPSGVEWIGEIPDGWKAKKLKFLVRRKRGAIKSGPFGTQLKIDEMKNEDVKVYDQKNVIDKNFEEGASYISNEKFKELQGFEVFSGDLLITTRGTIGRCAIMPQNAKKGVLHPCLMRVQVDKTEINLRLLEFLINGSSLFLEQVKMLSNGTTIEVIYTETIKNLVIITCPMDEQAQIIEFLNKETTRIDKIIEKTEKQIELMQEYKQSLTTAAVTGKIDVREAI